MREILDNCFEGRIVNGNALNKAQLSLCPMEKNAQHECCELSFFGPNEHYSPGDSMSDGSEKLLQRSTE